MGCIGLFEYLILLSTFNVQVSKCQRGCYFSILDLSRLDTCLDERGGIITDLSQREAGHATICTYSSCNSLRHIECADGSWLEIDKQGDVIDMEPPVCDEASLLTKKQKRVKKFLWGGSRSSPPPPPPPPPNCGMPGDIRGASVSVTSTEVGGTATYTCQSGYVYTKGDLNRTCQSSAQWSGTEPVCAYMNSCSSFPCRNEGTCTNVPESYTCSCHEIWKGANCEQEALVCARNQCVNHVLCEDGDTIYTCICKPGWSGINCNIPVSCGDPVSVVNVDARASQITLGGITIYSCHEGYNATTGSKERVCQSDGTWSGEPLICKNAVSCGSSPCKNQATCTNLIEDFQCTCKQGWAGKNCDEDVQPPIVTNCPNDIRVNATEKTHTVSWSEPSFTDPMETDLHLFSYYENPNYIFPWGDFTVQYSATKLKNGLRTECAFNISVRPTPCDPPPVPKHGTILCNSWNSDYGQMCLLVCERAYAPKPPGKLGTWMICGDDGRWSSEPTDCFFHMKNETNLLVYHANYGNFSYDRCNDYMRFRYIFLAAMHEDPDVSEFCQLYPGCEDSSSVQVYCEE